MNILPKLFLSRKFLPIFLAQFGGALNDNLFKSALLVIVAFQLTDAPSQASTVNNLAAILFILPFFLLSYIAGQLADRANKASMIQKNKIAEIVISCFCIIALWAQSLYLLLFVLVLLGAQSAMFGPNKYAVLPQLLKGRDLVQGNAHIATGTFVAILSGTLIGALLAQSSYAWIWIGATMLIVAGFGYLSALQIPETKIGEPELQIDWNPFTQLQKLIRLATKNRNLWLTMLGLSWFWFLGTAYLTQIPALVRFFGGGDESVVTLFLLLFICGVGAGCLISAKISGAKPELGLVPFALIGLCFAGIDFALISPNTAADLLNVNQFVATARGFHISLDIFIVGLFGGAFSIPLYAALQSQSRLENRARMIALSNMLNAFAMVISSALALIIIGLLDLSLPTFLILVASLNAAAAIFFFRKLLLESLQFSAMVFSRCLYRIQSRSIAKIPESGAALLVGNHVSYLDPVIISGQIRRPIRFIIDQDIYSIPLLHWAFRNLNTIPVCSPDKNRSVYLSAIDEAVNALKNGELVMIFPEGRLTRDGNLETFKRGLEKILKHQTAPVYPIALDGLWGSFFSHGNGPALRSRPRLPWYRVSVLVGDAIAAEHANAERLYEEIHLLCANA